MRHNNKRPWEDVSTLGCLHFKCFVTDSNSCIYHLLLMRIHLSQSLWKPATSFKVKCRQACYLCPKCEPVNSDCIAFEQPETQDFF